MNFKWIALRFKRMFLSPKAELYTVRDESGMMSETYFFLFLCCFFIGLSYISKGFSNLFYETAIWFATTLLATLAAWQLAPKFDAVTTWAKSLKVIVFSFFPFFTCVALSNFIGYKPLLLSVGAAYALYLLYSGIKIVCMPAKEQSIPYTFVIFVAAVLSNYVARILIP